MNRRTSVALVTAASLLLATSTATPAFAATDDEQASSGSSELSSLIEESDPNEGIFSSQDSISDEAQIAIVAVWGTAAIAAAVLQAAVVLAPVIGVDKYRAFAESIGIRL